MLRCRRFLMGFSGVVLAVVLACSQPGAAAADDFPAQPIYVQNNTSRPIWVAVRYKPPGNDAWVTGGYWEVQPGKKHHVVNNGNGRYIYLHAHDAQGGAFRCQSSHVSETFKGRAIDLYAIDTGPDYVPWLITLENVHLGR